jgi:hypothetical protein
MTRKEWEKENKESWESEMLRGGATHEEYRQALWDAAYNEGLRDGLDPRPELSEEYKEFIKRRKP